ncbi:C40 family peptidase [Pseudobacillus wudalianchiensis]|uniref:Hydrolase Nlp/P60 n=1 Tax=Pseudobacillus wudalianchiensis TaxID=1743143 RepID=A0A1B9AMR7_9BACI|nr:C40 family peptidase [Bacillus wudalianchiensis]OCA85101.1 hydrolase Nlp/P60 [Bacillus wudalianchiensis]
MNIYLPVSRWAVALFTLFAFAFSFACGPVKQASATINYGEEVAAKAEILMGAPYKYGGTSPKGFDAGGFTQYVYKEAATKMKIPRTSADQYKIGKAVKQKDLQFGDLVFYATGAKGKVSFVAVYTGNGKFVGATSKGVKEVKMNEKYWKDRYVGAKRVIK